MHAIALYIANYGTQSQSFSAVSPPVSTAPALSMQGGTKHHKTPQNKPQNTTNQQNNSIRQKIKQETDVD